MTTETREAWTVQILKTKTKLYHGKRLVSWSSGRLDHAAHILAWCDENGVRPMNDPRFEFYRGTYRIVDGKVVRTVG